MNAAEARKFLSALWDKYRPASGLRFMVTDEEAVQMRDAFAALGSVEKAKQVQNEIDRRASGAPIPVEKKPKYKETAIEHALRVALLGSGALGYVPHKREPCDPIVEAEIAERWAKMKETDRTALRNALAVLNIPMQDGLE